MLNNPLTPPLETELEISIFGPGYGEAILIHVGSQWVLVDSCLEPQSKQPVSLKYLTELGVNLENEVKLIVATHWHDDHIRGLSTLLEQCLSAKLAISDVLSQEQFLTLTQLYADNNPSLTLPSGVDEFTRIFQILSRRKNKKARFNPPILASANKLLYHELLSLSGQKSCPIRVYALSPADSAMLQARMAFASLMPQAQEMPKRLKSLLPNHTSVVLWLEIGERKLLLGADLEVTKDSSMGWQVILSETSVAEGQAELFKIPHHGSSNAHHQDVWLKLLTPNPIALVTPYNKGRKALPSESDIQRITQFTPNGYATASAKSKKQKWQRSMVREMVGQVTKSVQNISQGWGHIRLRCNLTEPHSEWQVELFGDAYHLAKHT